jgi:hypothetical protein
MRKRERGVLHELVGDVTNHQTRDIVSGIEGEARPPARAREQLADERCRRRGRQTRLSRRGRLPAPSSKDGARGWLVGMMVPVSRRS